jgi:hypothetical protein
LIRSSFPSRAALVLRRAERVARAVAVAGGDPELVVGAPLQLAAVVVGELSVADLEQIASRARRRAQGVALAPPELGDAQIALAVGEVDVEAARAAPAGEGDREQPALPLAAAHEVADVEEGAAVAAVAQHPDPARALDHEEDARGALGPVRVDRLVEGPDLDEPQPAALAGAGRDLRDEGREGGEREGDERETRAHQASSSRPGRGSTRWARDLRARAGCAGRAR